MSTDTGSQAAHSSTITHLSLRASGSGGEEVPVAPGDRLTCSMKVKEDSLCSHCLVSFSRPMSSCSGVTVSPNQVPDWGRAFFLSSGRSLTHHRTAQLQALAPIPGTETGGARGLGPRLGSLLAWPTLADPGRSWSDLWLCMSSGWLGRAGRRGVCGSI